jgi:hypothetical protein
MRRNNTGMMVGGIVLTSVGAVGAIIGVSIASAAEQELAVRCDSLGCYEEPYVDEEMRIAGIATALSGLALVAVGIPLIVVGARKVPVTEAERTEAALTPTLNVLPGGANLTWRF